MRKIILVVIVILLLAGCSSQRGLSRADLCVQRVEDKAQICYGMERAEVEKVAGKGEIAPHGKYLIYNNGLAVNYRDKAVSLIYITEGDYYEHVSGAKIGDLPDELRKKYGTASVDGQGIRDGSIAYDYDLKNKKLLKIDDRKNLPTHEQPENFITLGVLLDGNGYIDLLAVGDLRAYLTGK
ncbi:hypothetical protein FLT15_23680 [Paenibacillus thiaminolyticus]|uniref:hypothetical protein n=1 Tax=Paenibacillus thiaminolyticus TaxID=49283 RepID=UPI0011620504|nr:hypothetical protein [Paenibacillus thiaminolyticus]NGP61236.1 hypothetical protein [Paenibacillus thiaminolyticus]